MAWECFDVSIEHQIAHIVMNRPEKRNSMCASFWTDLPAIVQEIDRKASPDRSPQKSAGPSMKSRSHAFETALHTGPTQR